MAFSDEEPEEVDCEDLYKVIYVEDFCDTVNLVPDDTARHISLLMDMDADRMRNSPNIKRFKLLYCWWLVIII